MKFIKLFINIIYIVFIILVVAVAGGLVLSKLDTPVGVRVFSVISGSMEPKIPMGSVVFTKALDTYSEGDVVTAKEYGNQTRTFTHRITQVIESTDETETPIIMYQTKGDANEDPDATLTPKRWVIGKVCVTIPGLGFVINFVNTQLGFMLLVMMPVTLIVVSELLNVKKEVIAWLEKRKQDNQKKQSKQVQVTAQESTTAQKEEVNG